MVKRNRLTETLISRQETIIVPKVASARSSDSYLRIRSEMTRHFQLRVDRAPRHGREG